LSQHLLRPRFELHVRWDADAVVRRFQQRLALPDSPCRGMVADLQRVIDLRVRPEDKHLWSPALGLQIEPAEDGEGAVVHGLIGPEPGVWTGIAFAYVGMATGVLFLLTLGTVQWSLDHQAWAFWLAGLLLFGIASVWLVARTGQRLAAPQTAQLRHFLEEVLELPREEQARTDADPYHP
jgi:hypothetical protein